MASVNTGAQHQQEHQHQQQKKQQHPQQFHLSSGQYHCKKCRLTMNSAESLSVHLQYHSENLMTEWTTQPAATAQTAEETNNNNTKANNIKREFITNSNTVAATDSSDNLKKSPEYHRATPENNYTQPPTPQSFQSASSPFHDSTQYQNNSHEFSAGFPHYAVQIKTEQPPSPLPNQYYAQGFNESFYGMDQQQQLPQFAEYGHKNVSSGGYRYAPYSVHHVQTSGPVYPPQPTPSPSPKQCEKCGFICESPAMMADHMSISHPPTPAATSGGYHHNFMFNSDAVQIKVEDETQSEILDLDSHKVHQVYPPEDEKQRQNGESHSLLPNPHPVTSLLWASPQQQKLYHQEAQQQRMFQSTVDYGVITSSTQPSQSYRPFDHISSQSPQSVISSTQVPNPPQQASPASSGSKGTNWKSNEARRPKTYNCTACNKWFTSSGHLKRHYNTTLHKNAVKSSGQPDPATMPISAHHHPARDSNSNKEDHSGGSPGDDDTNSIPTGFERQTPRSGLLQQPPNGPYDRQPAPPNILHTSPMTTTHPAANLTITNLPNGSPPNGEAGLSPSNLESRGLLSLNTNPNTSSSLHGFSSIPVSQHHQHMMAAATAASIDITQHPFQMYPNESAPHVTQQVTEPTSNRSISGNFRDRFKEAVGHNSQPLPSFAQFGTHRRFGALQPDGLDANVGGGGPATAPYTLFTECTLNSANDAPIIFASEEDYKLTVLTAAEPLSNFTPNESLASYTGSDMNADIITGEMNSEMMTAEMMGNTDIIVPYSPVSSPFVLNNSATTTTMVSDISDALISRMPTNQNNKIEIISDIQIHIKRDYEDEIASPHITSSLSPSNNNNNNTSAALQSNKPTHCCSPCNKQFNKACYLTQHNKTFHCGEKPYKCSRCGKRFPSEPVYQEHLSKHAGEKPHKCIQCPKQFNHKTDLRRHMCLHTGHKPYSCETCKKGFIRKDHMLKHCETHYRKINNKVAAAIH